MPAEPEVVGAQDRRGRGAGHRTRRTLDALYRRRAGTDRCRHGGCCRASCRRPRCSGCSPAGSSSIGAGAIGLRDLVATPVADRELGVVVHAQAVEQMVLQDFLYRPDWAAGLEMACCSARRPALASLLPWIGAFRGAAARAGDARRSRRRQLVRVPGTGICWSIRPRRSLALLACYIVATLFTYRARGEAAAATSTAPSTAISRPSWSSASPTIRASSSSAARCAR